MKAVVTGGAGFIGSHIAEQLIQDGYAVVVIDDLSNGDIRNIPDGFDLFQADISKDQLDKAFQDVDLVFHNAAVKCTYCLDDPQRDMMVNAWGSWRVFDAAQKVGAKVIHASTGSVYGDSSEFLSREDLGYNPKSFYGVSKLAGERYLRAFASQDPVFRYSILRYFHVFGPRQDWSDKGGVIPIFIRRVFDGKPITIYGSGDQRRSFTYVDDVVRANLLVANDDLSEGEAFDCASGIAVSINTLAETIMILMGETVPIEYKPEKVGDIRRFQINNHKIQALGMVFDTDFEKNLKDTIDWYIDAWSSQA